MHFRYKDLNIHCYLKTKERRHYASWRQVELNYTEVVKSRILIGASLSERVQNRRAIRWKVLYNLSLSLSQSIKWQSITLSLTIKAISICCLTILPILLFGKGYSIWPLMPAYSMNKLAQWSTVILMLRPLLQDLQCPAPPILEVQKSDLNRSDTLLLAPT